MRSWRLLNVHKSISVYSLPAARKACIIMWTDPVPTFGAGTQLWHQRRKMFLSIFSSFSAKVRRSRSSKVIDVGRSTNRKCVCDFLLVRHSNLCPILHRFRDIAGFLHPTLFHPNYGGVPVGPDGRCWFQSDHVPQAMQPWNYFRSIPNSNLCDHGI